MKLSLFLLAAGLIIMSFGVDQIEKDQLSSSWAKAFIVLGDNQKNVESQWFKATPMEVKLLPTSPRKKSQNKIFYEVLDNASSINLDSAKMHFQEHVIFVPHLHKLITEDDLQSGRLPNLGENEVLAGALTQDKNQINFENQKFEIVGILKPSVGIFKSSYLLEKPQDESLKVEKSDSKAGYIVQFLKSEQSIDPEIVQAIFPEPRIAALKESVESYSNFYSYWEPFLPVKKNNFLIVLFGFFLLIWGGSKLFIRLFDHLSRSSISLIKEVAAQTREHQKLFNHLHVFIWGCVLLFMFLASEELEIFILLNLFFEDLLLSSSNELGEIGKILLEGDIFKATWFIFTHNFKIAFLFMTLLSAVVPGSGIFFLSFQALIGSFVLSPLTSQAAEKFIPHTATWLLEFEAYIFCTFLALLFPLALYKGFIKKKIVQHYKETIIINLKGSLIVGFLLLIGAFYESVELIHLLKNP